MPTTTNFQISYDDYFEGYQEDFAFDGHQVTRPCILAWADRANFKTGMLGYSVTDGKNILRTTPESHPEYSWLYAQEVHFSTGKGVPNVSAGGLIRFDAPGGAGGTGKVIAQVVYQAVDYEIKEDGTTASELDRYVSRYVAYSVENLQVTGGSFMWTVGGQTFQEPMTKIFITRTYRYVWHQVPAVSGIRMIGSLESTINSTLGKTNNANFDGRYAANTLLFTGVDPVPSRSAEGERAMEIEYTFQYRSQGWNTYYRYTGADGPGFYEVTSADNKGKKPYEAADFDLLFRIG